MSTQKPDGVDRASADTQGSPQPATPHAGAATDRTAAAASSAATSSSRSRAPPQNVDGDELRAERVRLQQRLGAVGLGMARAAAVASRSADEVEARQKRRREQKATCERKRRKAAAEAVEAASEAEEDGESGDEGESEDESEGESEAEYAWVPPSKALREEARARWRGEDDTAEYERLEAERRADEWSAAGQPDDGRGVFYLEGSPAEQHARFHDVTRRYRLYTDR